MAKSWERSEEPIVATGALQRVVRDVSGRQADRAEYIADMADALASMARGANLELLAYLLDIARLEADSTVVRLRGERPSRNVTGS